MWRSMGYGLWIMSVALDGLCSLLAQSCPNYCWKILSNFAIAAKTIFTRLEQ